MAFSTNNIEDRDEDLQENEKIEKAVKEQTAIPSAYIPIELSTKGEFGAPELFHIRNMSTAELLDLTATAVDDMPTYVVELLQKLIYEDNVDIKNFHEKEVVETLFLLYRSYYSTVWTGLPWKMLDEDYEFLEKQCGGKTDEYFKKIDALKTGKWKPTFDLDLSSIHFYDVMKAEGPTAEISKPNGFTCEFGFPRYGDSVFLKKFVQEKFKEEDKRFANLRDQILTRNKQKEEYEAGERLRPPSVYIPEAEEKMYNEYEKRKLIFSSKALLAVSLKKIRGEDVSEMDFSKKILLVDDPDLDHTVFGPIVETYKNIKIGINDKFLVKDPITFKPVEITFPFRIFDILQAMSDHKSDTTTVVFKRKNK